MGEITGDMENAINLLEINYFVTNQADSITNHSLGR
jgi:hypothetical protein